MKKINALALLILFALVLVNSASAQKRDLKSELLVYVLPDSLEIEQKSTNREDRPNIVIKSTALANTIKTLGQVVITKGFPNWNAADSIKTNAAGLKFRVPAFDRVFVFTFDSRARVPEAQRILSQLKCVIFAEQHSETVPADIFINDPIGSKFASATGSKITDPSYLSGAQWHLTNDGRNSGVVGADINALDAWGIFTGSSGVTITFFDSGIDLAHEELVGKSTGDTYDPAYFGKNHGTLVAGIAAANANNAKGGRGVDWAAQISSRRIFNSYSSGNYIGDNGYAAEIVAAANGGSQVGNHSTEGATYQTTLAMAFSYAYKMNITSVAAMGNGAGTSTQYPAGYNNVIAVGSSKNDDTHSSLFSNTGNHIDVVAPGGGVFAFGNPEGIYSSDLGNTYQFAVGTSYAVPQVAGLASLLKGYNSSLSNDDIVNIIKLTAEDKGALGWDATFGAGRIDAGNALGVLQAPNTINHFTATGGTLYATVGPYISQFLSVVGLADGSYLVKRHEVRKAVTFPYSFCNVIGAWGRGIGSLGFSPASPNYAEGFCEVVPGTLTTTGATLRTYVYEISTLGGQAIGYTPTLPANAVFAYTVLGEAKNQSISGPDVICSSSNYTIANLIPGSSVTWSVAPSGYATLSPSGNSVTVTKVGDGVITLTAIITTACGSRTVTKEITLGPPIITPDYYSYNGNSYGPLVPYYSVPNNPVSAIGSTVSAYFSIKGAISTNVQLTGQSSSPTITHGIGMGNQGGYLYFEFNQANEWVSFRVTATNACGSSDYNVAFYSPDDMGRYAYWPNPASSELKVAFQYHQNTDRSKQVLKNYEINLFDHRGKIVKSARNSSSSNEIVIDIRDLPNDTYFLHILEGKTTIKKQVIIQH